MNEYKFGKGEVAVGLLEVGEKWNVSIFRCVKPMSLGSKVTTDDLLIGSEVLLQFDTLHEAISVAEALISKCIRTLYPLEYNLKWKFWKVSGDELV